MAVQHDLATADSAAAEIAAAEAWRDALGPQDGVHFIVRQRETHEPVPMDKASPDAFADLEIIFLPTDGRESEPAVWRPISREALEILLVE